MGEIINLRIARKRAERAHREALAAENRTRHSVPGRLRRAQEHEAELAARRLDAHRRDKEMTDEE